MDQVAEYREIIKRLLCERERMVQPVLPEGLEVRCFFDDERGQYALITLGWMKRKRISGNTLFLTLRGQQIWIEDDMTDAPIANALIEEGVSPQDVVLAFHLPNTRQYAETIAA